MRANRFKIVFSQFFARIGASLDALLVLFHLRKNRQMLSFAIVTIKEKSRKSEKKYFIIKQLWQKKLRLLFSNYYAAIVVTVVFLIILSITPLDQWINLEGSKLTTTQFQNFFLTLWQVQASMLGITFVIIMFLVGTLIAKVESTYEEVSGRIVHELLITSQIYSILAFCLLSMIYIGFTTLFQIVGQTYQNLLLFVTNIALIFYLFYAAFNFFRPLALEKIRRLQLKDELINNINEEINRRLADRVLMNLKGNLSYAPLGVFDRSSVDTVKNPIVKPKIMKDLNVGQLLRLSEKVPIQIYKNIGSIVSNDNDVLCFIPIGTSTGMLEQIRKCFVLTEVDEEAKLSDAMDGVQEELHEAIQRGNVVKLERLLNLYLVLLESFLEQTSSFGIHYNLANARLEGSYGWKAAFRIVKSIEQEIEYAFKQEDLETIEQLLYFPRRVFALSMKYDDHLLAQQFDSVLLLAYFLNSKTKNARISNIVIDRSWRYLSEMGLRYNFLLQHAEKLEKIHNLTDYVVEVLLSFNKLLKAALDNEDIESFKKFGDALDGILEHFEPRPSAFELQIKMNNPNLSPQEKGSIGLQLELKEELEKTRQKTDSVRALVWFGLGGWVTRLYRAQKLPSERFSAFFNEISTRFDTMEKISSAFGNLGISEEINFGWLFWDMEDKKEWHVVVGSDSQEGMKWFYCLQGIRLSPTSFGNKASLSPNRAISSGKEATAKICNEISQEMKKWENILGDQAKGKISNFLLLNEQADKQQTEIEEKWLVEQTLSEDKVKEFQDKTIAAYVAEGNMEKIIEQFGRLADYDETDEKLKKITLLAINLLLDKAAFVDGWYVAYSGYEDQIGRAMGIGENKRILERICSSLELKQKSKKQKMSEFAFRNFALIGTQAETCDYTGSRLEDY